MKSILDPRFRYTNSAETDIRKTFARIRRAEKLNQGREYGREEMEVRSVFAPEETEENAAGLLVRPGGLAVRRKPLREREENPAASGQAD